MASLGQLAAGVAHEINNPVGFVNSNLGSLERYIEDLFKLVAACEAHEYELKADTLAALQTLKQDIDIAFLREDVMNLLRESMEGMQRVKQIVQDLKDFSHVGEAERQWANLERGLDSTLNMVRNEIKYKAEVVKEYAGVPDIECVPSQLNQVFMNLIVNAAHAIEERGTITVRTGSDAEKVWVEVRDTGSGISKDHLPRIFEPFYTTKPVGKGTGLGLSLSYGIVQRHRGSIEVTSEVGQGSCFKVTLPIKYAGA
jgi:two-component system NtrC family sensor kinase